MNRRVPVILLCIALAWAHQLWLWGWLVDDAAISFAYSRNLAMGEGLVPTIGGERVEGYSNPSWVGILAVVEWFGGSAWGAAKGFALLLTAVSILLADDLTQRLGGDGRLAAALLALSAPVAIWGASGLENPLFMTLLLAGAWTLERRWLVLSGLCWAGLALTRPEGAAYGLVASAWAVGWVGRNAWRLWLPFIVPVAAHQGFRWAYFAWPLPNTYYAKLGAPVDRWSVTARGWRQLWSFSTTTGTGLLLPTLASGLWGRRLPGLLALGIGVGVWFVEDSWRVGVLAGLAVAGPLFATGPVLLRMLAHLALVGLGFSVYAGGDWMRGYRWMSLVMGPVAVLFGVGLPVWTERLSEASRSVVRWVVVGGLLAVNLPFTQAFSEHPVDFPEMIGRRLAYTDSVAARYSLDPERLTVFDMDMGAHLLWSRYRMVDLAGLVDVPIARHRFSDRAFFRAYLFEENRIDFAHLHRDWARVSGLTRLPEWTETFVELPPYDDAGVPHGGVWIRREYVYREPRDRLEVGRGVVLDGIGLVHGAVGSRGLLEIGLHPDARPEGEVVLRAGSQRVELFRVDARWARGETFIERVFIEGEVAIEVDGEAVFEWRPPPAVPVEHAVTENARAGRCSEAVEGFQRALDLTPEAVSESWRTEIAVCLARTGRARAVERARHWDPRSPEVQSVAATLAEGPWETGLAARAAGDREAAFEAFSEVLRLTPHNAWARRYAEEAR